MEKIEVFCFTLTSLVGLILNIPIIYAAVTVQRPYICTRISSHLAASNIFGCVLVVFLEGLGDEWLIHKQVCKTFLIFKVFWLASAILLTSFLVFESFLKVNQSIKEKEIRNCFTYKINLVIIWLMSVTLAFFALLLTDITDRSLCVSYQHNKLQLVKAYLVVAIFIPLLILLGLNVFYKRMAKRHRQTVGVERVSSRGKRTQNNIIQKHMHYMKCSFRVSQMMILSWLPYTVYIFCLSEWAVYDIGKDEVTYHVLKFLQWLCYSTCVTQPLVLLRINYQIKNCVVKKWKSMFDSPQGEESESSKNIISTITASLTDLSSENLKPGSAKDENDNIEEDIGSHPYMRNGDSELLDNTTAIDNELDTNKTAESMNPMGSSFCYNMSSNIGSPSLTPIEASYSTTTPIYSPVSIEPSFSPDVGDKADIMINGAITPAESKLSKATPRLSPISVRKPKGAENTTTHDGSTFSKPTGGHLEKRDSITSPLFIPSPRGRVSFNKTPKRVQSASTRTPDGIKHENIGMPPIHKQKETFSNNSLRGKPSVSSTPVGATGKNRPKLQRSDNYEETDDNGDDMVQMSERQMKYVVNEEDSTSVYNERPSIDVMKMFQYLDSIDNESPTPNRYSSSEV